MKHITVSFVLAVLGLAVICDSHEPNTTKSDEPCIMYKCSDLYEPICGKQKVGDCWEEKIFRNNCYMLSANSCGKGALPRMTSFNYQNIIASCRVESTGYAHSKEMKAVVFFLIASLAAVHSYEETKTPCILYKCSTVLDPVCGKQMVNGCMEEKIFTNACHMASANGCGKANYVPCVENKCEKPVSPSFRH